MIVSMVNRCACYEVPFWEVAALAKRGYTFEQISEATRCCQSCGACEPYVRLVISTGATDLPVLSIEQQNAIMADAKKNSKKAAAKGASSKTEPAPPPA